VVLGVLPAAQAPEESTDQGVYTTAQAEKGSVLFSDVCRACHPDPFWRTSWRDRTVGDLYSIIVKSMPDDNPGSVSGGEAVEVLAYILQGNGAPSGAVPLPDDLERLLRIRLSPPR
jgi:hypothetical protein